MGEPAQGTRRWLSRHQRVITSHSKNNVAFFTKISIKAIKKIYCDIKKGEFKIDSYSNEESIKMVKEKLDKLKSFDFKGKYNVALTGLTISTVTTETTKSLDD